MEMGDYDSLRKKHDVADLVIEKDILELKTWALEKRTNFWNEIGSNKDSVETGDCGKFPREVAEEFYATSWLALAKLAVCSYELGEKLPGLTVNDKEIVVTKELESCQPIDLMSIEELKGKIIARDESIRDWVGTAFRLEKKREEIRKYEGIKKDLKIAIRRYYAERIEKCKAAIQKIDPMLREKLRKEYEEKEKKRWEEELEKVKRYMEDQYKKKEDEEKLRAEREQRRKEALEKGAPTGQVARAEEIKYIQAFHSKMEDLKNVKILNPRDGKEYEICRDEELNEEENIRRFFSSKVEAGEIPLNVRVRYIVGKKHLFGEAEEKMIFEAMVLSHWQKYGEDDYDNIESGDQKDLNIVLNQAIEEARKRDYFCVVGIASPTGWNNKVREFIYSSDFHRNYVSKYVPVCLIDIRPKEPLTSRTFIYNKNDSWIKDYLWIFHPQLQRESVEIAKARTKEKLFVDMIRSVTIEEIMKKTNQNFTTVKEAFYQLADEGIGEVMRDGTFRKFHEMEKKG